MYTVFQKKHVTTSSRIVELEFSVHNNFWHTYYQECRPSIYVFLFSHLTYFLYLLYCGKL